MEVGLYGKLPTHGDFLRRRVADDFVDVWDPWLQRCIAESRTTLGEQWLDTYLTSPVWRFVLGPHVCGAAAVAGIVTPSVDRVGRYFPFVLVWAAPVEFNSLEIAIRSRAGFERAERLLVATLALESFEFADFDRQVIELGEHLEVTHPEGAPRLTQAWVQASLASGIRPRCIPLKDGSAFEAPTIQWMGWQMEQAGARAIWWTEGSSLVAPSWLMTTSLPDPSSYCAMLDGTWAEAGWDLAATEPDPTATTVREDGIAGIVSTPRSAALTDRGPVRKSNQDAFVECPERGLWAVADGMGGLTDGELASRMVCDSLANVPLAASLDEAIEGVTGKLREVNAYLRRAATRATNPVQSGSTVVALLIVQRECAILWAGDSRAYRLRDGLVSQMTTDHSWAQQGGLAGDEQAITRAVGTEDALELDVARGDVRPGDRFFLCSDGIGRVLDMAALGRILQSGAAGDCCAQLIGQSIAQGGTDNLTALIVDCLGHEREEPVIKYFES